MNELIKLSQLGNLILSIRGDFVELSVIGPRFEGKVTSETLSGAVEKIRQLARDAVREKIVELEVELERLKAAL